MIVLALAAVVWLACGFLHYGLWVAYFQREYPFLAKSDRVIDRLLGVLLAILGPIARLIDLMWLRPLHGWML